MKINVIVVLDTLYHSDIELGNVKVEDIDTKYNYCPDCGIKIEL